MSVAPPSDDDRTVVLGAEPAVPAPLTHNALPVGTRLGEFEIVGLVGEGGFGIVYLAYDSSLDRKIALKEYMPSELAQRDSGSAVSVKSARYAETFAAGLRSFINEARLLAQFDHPSLVKVYRFWEANGTAYMVMPFYEGVTLKDALRVRDTPPDENWLKALLAQLLDALETIHNRQCYHRDIAPDNILMLSDDTPLLLDFGAARRVIGDMTQALTVILKPGYAPIEQYAEVPNMRQGPWTDLYALASVVYFAITGKAPIPAVARVMSDPLVPLSQSAAGRYSAAFLRGIDSALAVKPEERPQSVADFRKALDLEEWHVPSRFRSATSMPTRIPPTRAVAPEVSKTGKSRTKLYAASAGGLLALALATFGIMHFLSQPGDTKRPPEKTAKPDAPLPATPPAKESDGPPEGFADQSTKLLGAFNCAALEASLDGRTAVVRGQVSSEADLRRIEKEIGAIPGVQAVNRDAVRVVPPPYCSVVSGLGPAIANQPGAPAIALKGGATSAVEGSKIVTDITNGEFAGYAYADLYDPEGNVAHILPNSKDRKNQLKPGERLVLGTDALTGMQWEVVGPFGKHLLVVTTSSAPLFTRKREDVESAAAYTKALQEALRAQPSNVRVSVGYTVVEFQPKAKR